MSFVKSRRVSRTGRRGSLHSLALGCVPIGLVCAAPALAQDQPVTLDTIDIGAQRTTGAKQKTDDNAGVIAKQGSTATKTNTPLLETPQSVTVVTRRQLDIQESPTIYDALRFTAGVSGERGVNLTDDSFNLRGFAAGLASAPMAIYRDGLKQLGGTYAEPSEPYGLERLEVIRGPASVLYGQIAPGGLINLVTKRPSTVPLRELEVKLGSFDKKQISGDFGGAIDPAGIWSYRLTGLLRDSDTMVSYIPDDRRYIAPAVRFQPSSDTSLTLLARYQYSHTAFNWGLPAQGTVAFNPNGALPRHTFTGEPGFDKYNTEVYAVGYQFEHRFSDMFKVRQNFNRWGSELEWDSAYGSSLQTTKDPATNQRYLNRFGYMRRDKYGSWTVDNQLEMNFDTGPFEHKALVGLDYQNYRWNYKTWRGTVAALDLFNPVYGSPVLLNGTPNIDSLIVSDQLGVYFQDQLKFDQHWLLVGGGRQDWTTQTTYAYRALTTTVSNQDAFTGRAALMYLFDEGVSPYASYSTSFEPQTAMDYTGTLLKAKTGEQYEVGFKMQPPDADYTLSFAAYQLTQQNVPTADPDASHRLINPSAQVSIGEVRSRGFEVEGKATVFNDLDLLGSYTFTENKTMKSAIGTQGQSLPGVARNAFAIGFNYRPNFAALGMRDAEILQGLNFGANVRYTGPTFSPPLINGANVYKVPDYAVLDGMIGYEQEHWRLALNVMNILDNKYVAACYYSAPECFYGERRKLVATLRYRW
jgi:iron complex outermembrane receptor protein